MTWYASFYQITSIHALSFVENPVWTTYSIVSLRFFFLCFLEGGIFFQVLKRRREEEKLIKENVKKVSYQ